MLAEQTRYPEFFLGSYRPFTEMAIARQNEELALADDIVVGAESCAQTLVDNGCSRQKIRVVPYGFDETLFPNSRPLDGERRPPIRFLFVGAINPRKGIASLLHAFEAIPAAEATLTLVGRMEIPESTFARYRSRIVHVNSLPRREVVGYLLSADCFIFPSLFEGSALVLAEAIAAGLGIIQSAAAGLGVQCNRNGLVLQEINPSTIATAVRSLAAHPEQVLSWKEASWRMREERTWKRYRHAVRELIAA